MKDSLLPVFVKVNEMSQNIDKTSQACHPRCDEHLFVKTFIKQFFSLNSKLSFHRKIYQTFFKSAILMFDSNKNTRDPPNLSISRHQTTGTLHKYTPEYIIDRDNRPHLSLW
jgi:hypothetical protein